MADWLVVGLGNPGPRYDGTLHNIGAEVVDALAERGSVMLRPSKHRALTGEVRIASQRVLLAFPTTFMNESGQAVQALCRYHGISEAARVIVCHDELDLEPGRLKVKAGGGLAGHNGLRSIASHVGTKDFVRVRIGVGKPPSKERGADYVLAKIPKRVREEMDVAVARAADAVETIIEAGPTEAMNRHNG